MEIVFVEGLEFNEYYSVMSNCIGLCCNFPSELNLLIDEGYFIYRTTSTIGCSFITQTPLIIAPSELNIYSFLTDEAVWKKLSDNESDIEAINRILHIPKLQFKLLFTQKLIALKRLTIQLFNKNQNVINNLVKQLNSRV